MKNIQDFDVQNKRALVRCDFNVPLDDRGNVLEDFRLKKTLPTIEYLLKNSARIILISHLGEGEASLKPIAVKLEELLGRPVQFVRDCVGPVAQDAADKMKDGDILLLENLRFYSGEKENDSDFAGRLAKLADVYINDGFSVCHRAHASVVAITRFLPSGAGLLLQSEVKTLTGLLEKPARPLTVLIGGVKVSSKAAVIKRFLDIADYVLLNNKITDSLEKEDPEVNRTNPRLWLAIDGGPDIGPETIKAFSEIIKRAKTIFWSGPMGLVEDKKFAAGSLAVVEAIIESGAFSVAGGGDTTGFLEAYNLIDKFSYVSTGGGAMLEFLSGKILPGIEALK